MTGLRALTLPIGSELLAVPCKAAREVVEAPVVTPLPTAPPCVLGLFELRGEILPVIDAALLLGWEACATAGQVAVVESERGAAGLLACGPPATIELPDALGPSRRPATLGTAQVGGADTGEVEATVIDVDALLALASVPATAP